MPTLWNRIAGAFGRGQGLPRARPMREMGVSGTAVFGGYVQERETNRNVIGAERWRTYGDLVANTSIVAAGTRHFLNLAAGADWSVEPVDDTPEAKEASEFLESVLHDMATSWARIVRRAALYHFHGFGIQEWTARRRRDDGRIVFADIEARPQHTIERWEVDENGTVIGMWQVSPQTGQQLYLPRQKVVYLVDDTLTDSPEGIGVFRHLVETNDRLKEYLRLEGQGFARDLRGIPVGRAPYTALERAVENQQLTKEDANRITKALEEFVQTQAKGQDTSMVLDSQPYFGQSEHGPQPSGTPQWGVDLLSAQTSGLEDVSKAIDRLNREMARVLGVEHLLLGDTSGSRALSEDKSRNFWQLVNSTLGEITEGMERDIVGPIWALNGLDDNLKPSLKPSDVSFRSVEQVTSALRDMATAGAVLAPDDPAIVDVRDMLGVSKPPPTSPDLLGLMASERNGADPDADDLDPTTEGDE